MEPDDRLHDLIRTQVALGVDTFDEVVWRGVDYLAESLTVLRDLPVRTRSWAIYTSRSGQTVQHIWEDGPILWMEYLDPSQSASHGRHVSVAEARQVIVALAERDRVVLPELGDLVTQPW